ncbi:hypothetical protein CRG98_023657 [Punica granatum]|uniref:Uncharacterized protein n=1 Tax=Punica granatum TaxID=22663 RepID=A0A2I0JI56_PUNGR|nr:hypothetical protein CRG98_023657 [Punica granatum]
MAISIPSRHLFIAILCLLLIPDYQSLLESRAVPSRRGHNENSKGRVGGHGQKSDGSHVTGTPTSSHSPNPADSQVSGSRRIWYSWYSDGNDYDTRANSPPLPVDQDPLEATTYRCNCTL